MEKSFSQQNGNMPYAVAISAKPIGDDLVVMVWGGEKPHIGAIAISIPRPSLENPQNTSATTSVFTLSGHKEDSLARTMAQEIASTLNKNVTLTAGIHVDNISGEGIETIEANCLKLVDRLTSYYKT